MTQKERLVKLLTGKSIATDADVDYVADYLLDNGVIVPPCKVGDKIYFIYPKQFQNDTIKEGVVTQLALAAQFAQSMFPGESVFLFEEIGEKLFPTREQAEQALKERKANE